MIEDKVTNYLSQIFHLDRERPIAVLLSGGVDSSVALASLVRYGCRKIKAYYLKIWFQEDAQFLGDCPWEEDLDYASAICEQLDIPLHVLPMQQEYYDYVVEYTLAELRSGRTPSPDVLCNQYVKFGAFMRHLDKIPLITTGHYARLEPRDLESQQGQKGQKGQIGKTVLMRQAPDPVKDQSYFLARLSAQQLQNLLFPLGCLQKHEVRILAEHWNLATAKRKDSQGICFLGKVKFRDFSKHYLGENPGPILDYENEKPLGEHRGLWFHTIGQRQGLNLGGGPWYVCAKDMEKNILYVRHGQGIQNQLLRDFAVDQGTWLLEEPSFTNVRAAFPDGGSLSLKLRHGPTKIPCEIEAMGPDSWRVNIQEGDRGVAPGQFAVFYWQDICLGSARIRKT